MGRFGNCKFDDLKKFQDKLNKLNEQQVNLFIEACAKELAARLLAKVIKRTPVGEYPKSSGKKGGTLRRGWTAGKRSSAIKYVNDLTIHHFGDTYVIEIMNPIDYASYVEFGHRTSNHKGWVQGRFMLTISEQEIESAAPKILERKLSKKLGEVFK
ncbi:HK97 gp10 family phage protein [Vallitalea guaymasensis]|uniref:HK97 gp10 family phage protein n=1 Tax=Vallitalea guaymasensis TaxID=1185412 RepID=UPI000DE52AB6|nr:HK97 gp10 family phage protein [Vallitalea guaymasensis]